MMRTGRPFRVLVAEDDYLLARDISEALEQAGMLVIGPLPTLSETVEALAEPSSCDLAVLDINLGKDFVFPAADMLVRQSLGFVFFSGHDDIIIPERFSDAARVSKSRGRAELVRAIFRQRQRHLERLISSPLSNPSDVRMLIPRLRLRARELSADSVIADRLVARALETAIALAERGEPMLPMSKLLFELVEKAYEQRRH